MATKKKKETTTTRIRRSRPSKKSKPDPGLPGDQARAEAAVTDPGSTLLSNAQ